MRNVLRVLAIMIMAWIVCAFMFSMAGASVFPFAS